MTIFKVPKHLFWHLQKCQKWIFWLLDTWKIDFTHFRTSKNLNFFRIRLYLSWIIIIIIDASNAITNFFGGRWGWILVFVLFLKKCYLMIYLIAKFPALIINSIAIVHILQELLEFYFFRHIFENYYTVTYGNTTYDIYVHIVQTDDVGR